MAGQSVYVSITGLTLKKGLRNQLRFWWYAIRSMAQARRAAGNLSAEARTIDGVHHTLSVWTDERAMRAYFAAGAHRRALAVFHTLATGRVYGFTTDQVPDWTAAQDLWATKGRNV